MTRYRLSHLRELEAEAIHVFREVVAEFELPVMLYSVGKDSTVLARIAQKAFYPGKIPFPALFVDTTFKFPEMYSHRDSFLAEVGIEALRYENPAGAELGMNPFDFSTQQCCAVWKTGGLLEGLKHFGVDAAFGGARRAEEKSRAKERIYSFRDANGQWDPKNQRPELWNLYNARRKPGETIRVFPLSNWTEVDVWQYIHLEQVPVVSLYFAQEREMVSRKGLLLPNHPSVRPQPEELVTLSCRFRSIGCMSCTGAVESTAASVPEIIEELMQVERSERATRAIDHDEEGSMENKKREGYF
ncbi:MAG TPA: sulfate adenylyltransferase subunit CysD [Planctomycetes bacterium]|nr:sulfate adenylyltransferase subunit CysD [Planctomycetota bacterium]